MDDLDSSIQLNVFTKNTAVSEKRKAIKGNRGSRIKARKQQKALARDKKDRESVQRPDDSSDGGINETNGERKRKSGTNIAKIHHDSSKKTKTQSPVFISSLFKYNPDIPQVEKVPVKRKAETVFSQKSFKDLELHQFMISNLEERLGLSQMTAVQQQTIPHILSDKDVLVKSQTGTGKTLTFAIPIVQILQGLSPKVQRSDGIYAVVIVPTRELAIQCHETFLKLVYPFQWIVPGCLMGGEKRKSEKARLRKGINILVATPGRLLDHAEHTNSLSLDRVKWLVIDEADRMLDMGYEKDVAKVITLLNKNVNMSRQTVLLSATLTEGVERLAGISLHNSVRVDMSHGETQQVPVTREDKQENFAIPDKLRQHFVITPCKLRLVTLAAFILLKGKMIKNPGKILVFLSTRDAVEFHYNLFNHFFGADPAATVDRDEDDHLDFFKLHGEMCQKDRSQVYQEFCKASKGVLFCTDVASRGLHLPQVRWIVQYTTPGAATDYIHRVGRTARAGKQGHSILFLMPSEVDYVKVLSNHNISMEEIQMGSILKTLILAVQDMYRFTDTQRSPPKTFEESATYLQLCFENYLCEKEAVLGAAKKAYQSFVRAYATYPQNLKSIFSVKNLHLGHLAKSFGLRDAPSDISSLIHRKKNSQDSYQRFPRNKGQKSRKSFSSLAVSEFSSGLQKGSFSKMTMKKSKKKR